jgi:hypothetical protein
VTHGTPTDNPGTNQHSPPGQTDLHPGKKEKKKLNNKQAAGKKKRHIAKRVGHLETGGGHAPFKL